MKQFCFAVAACALLIFASACTGGSNSASNSTTPEPVEADTTTGAEDFPTVNNLIKEDPNNPDLYYRRARLLLDAGAAEKALADIDRALGLDSSKARYYVLQGDAWYSMRQTVPARKALEKALKLDPENVDAHLNMANIYLLLRQPEKCFEYVNNGLRIDVHNPRGYFIKGLNYIELADTNTAISSILTAIEQNPEYYEAYMVAGNLLAGLHDPLAESYYTNALSIRDSSIEALYARALFRQEHGKPDRAEVDYLAILHLDSTNYNAWFGLGYVNLVKLNNYEKGRQHFDVATSLNPDAADAWYNMGFCHEHLGQMEDAERCYREALEVNPAYELSARGLSRIIDGDYR